MSDLQLSPQSALLNAMRQLQQAGVTLPDKMIQQLNQVEVKLLPGNQLMLSLANRQVVIAASELKGKLQNGQLYQLLTDNKAGGRLLFYPPLETATNTARQQSIPLHNAALDSLLPAIIKNQPGLADNLTFTARVLNQHTAALLLDVQGQSVRLALSSPLPEIRPGQQVEVSYQRQQGQWTVKLLGQELKTELKTTNAHSSPSRPGAEPPPLKTVTTEWPVARQGSELFRQIIPLSKAQIVDVAQLKQWVSQLPAAQQKSLLPLLQGVQGEQVQSARLHWPANAQAQLLLTTQPPLATLVLGKQVLQQTITNLQPNAASGSLESAQKAHAGTPAPVGDSAKTLPTAPPFQAAQAATSLKVEGHNPPGQQVVLQSSQAGPMSVTEQQAPAPLSKTQLAASKVEPQSPLYQTLQELGRRLLSQQDSPTRLLHQIDTALTDNRSVATDSSKLLNQLNQHIKQSLPQGAEQDVGALRAILTTPALSLTPLQLVSTNNNQGLVGALVTLLQVTLASRLANQTTKLQTNQGQKLLEGLTSLLDNVRPSAGAPPLNQRNLADLAQLEQRHQLLNTLGRLLGGHSHSKIRGAEAQIQGQDSFYYNLPIGQGEARRDIELLVRREPPPSKKNKPQQSADRQWHLTMKLDIGDQGGLLAKARLYQTEVELDFYAANPTLRDQVIEFIPHLKKRLTALGIQVNHSHCQLGKIPEHLQQRPYQVFETKA
ncbi:flagellar hook-length control protein FliK [Bowmanella pacifica]|uniref:Flagellar hook-length control protein FliK n=1 Tax=Bowmanella pacifica TaxID=502051 RepID=A0A917YWJ8_9ALTE|nr:flagellar hook-length control protein FliK [Bowmanella pacifica]GGO67439.1 hypothetical protein GCM10010982_13900 [Bowmanella pacifica]